MNPVRKPKLHHLADLQNVRLSWSCEPSTDLGAESKEIVASICVNWHAGYFADEEAQVVIGTEVGTRLRRYVQDPPFWMATVVVVDVFVFENDAAYEKSILLDVAIIGL